MLVVSSLRCRLPSAAGSRPPGPGPWVVQMALHGADARPPEAATAAGTVVLTVLPGRAGGGMVTAVEWPYEVTNLTRYPSEILA